MIRHIVAFCPARQHQGVEVAVRGEVPRRFVVTVRRDGLEPALTFAWRSRGWDLAGYHARKDGEQADMADVAAALALLGQREGTAGSSPVRAGPPQRSNDVEPAVTASSGSEPWLPEPTAPSAGCGPGTPRGDVPGPRRRSALPEMEPGRLVNSQDSRVTRPAGARR